LKVVFIKLVLDETLETDFVLLHEA